MSSTLKKTISTLSLKSSKNVMWNMYIRLLSIHGVRFYDPDKHIIEVGENMQAVTRRFLANGMTPEQVAQRMDVPLSYINEQM